MASAASTTAAPQSNFSSVIAYLYFLRFSILLWLSMPLLAVADWAGAASMTRGIVALNTPAEIFFAAFFVTLNGWIALLTTRIVCAYGDERFGVAPPEFWKIKDRMRHTTFWLAQLPGFVLLAYVVYRTRAENHDGWNYPGALGYVLLGILAALGCWLLMACVYYWLYWGRDPENPSVAVDDPPRPFMSPETGLFAPIKRLYELLRHREPSIGLLAFVPIFKFVARLGEGYRRPPKWSFNPLHSGHAVGILALAFSLLIYLVFWDLTAPIPLPTVHSIVKIAVVLLLLVWLAGGLIYKIKVLDKREGGRAINFKDLGLMVVLFLPMLLVCSLPFWAGNRSDMMPVLATLSVLMLFITWTLSAFAFFFDRFRVPVLTVVLTLGAVINFLPDSGWLRSDHSVDVADATHTDYSAHMSANGGEADLPTPAQALESFEAGSDPAHPRPVIVVTATGGGIHAAAWTAGVLAKLEETFHAAHSFAMQGRDVPDVPEFHDSILHMSTVSGGSAGTILWAAEYLKDQPDFVKDAPAMREIAGCSSLQAVAWGLAYADFMRLFYPLQSPFGDDLDRYDRGWALQQAMKRNRLRACISSGDPVANDEDTVGDLAWKKASAGKSAARVPAFSFNTTIAETGSRFLSSNYRVPPQTNPHGEVSAADNFLSVYHRDLPLSSAARLSANFPYVSPMSRVNVPGSHFHFGDGGYFDNDGTSTAMEFLWYAFAMDQPTASSRSVPLRILVIEIRDSPDLPADSRDNLATQSRIGKDWGLAGQTMGPLATFYAAGHQSVTRRNRRELAFLEGALNGRAELTHLVLDYKPEIKNQPLSWHLTRRQQEDIKEFLRQGCFLKKTEYAVTWYRNAMNSVSTPGFQEETCPKEADPHQMR